MALTARIVLDVQSSQTSALDLETVASPLSYRKVIDIANGTGAYQATKRFTDTRTLAPSGTEDIDLSGVLIDGFGSTLLFTRIVAIIIEASSANTNLVNVSVPIANGFITPFAAASDTVKVRPGGFMALAAPDATAYVVTAGTGDLLTITNSAAGTSVTYNLVILGS
jgi:hypothetical protein